jgi:hypothetical protein
MSLSCRLRVVVVATSQRGNENASYCSPMSLTLDDFKT